MFSFGLSNSSFEVYYVSIALWLFTPEALFEFESRLILNFSQSVTFDTNIKTHYIHTYHIIFPENLLHIFLLLFIDFGDRFLNEGG